MSRLDSMNKNNLDRCQSFIQRNYKRIVWYGSQNDVMIEQRKDKMVFLFPFALKCDCPFNYVTRVNLMFERNFVNDIAQAREDSWKSCVVPYLKDDTSSLKVIQNGLSFKSVEGIKDCTFEERSEDQSLSRSEIFEEYSWIVSKQEHDHVIRQNCSDVLCMSFVRKS